jgi:hypothetical protein
VILFCYFQAPTTKIKLQKKKMSTSAANETIKNTEGAVIVLDEKKARRSNGRGKQDTQKNINVR